jgi:branched-chain amino acid transport system substrate-binding protein
MQPTLTASCWLATSLLLAWFTAGSLALARTAEPPPAAPVPYLDFRQQSLQYYGSDRPLTDSSEIHVGWFGPHLEGSLGADAFWAAQLAVDEANSARPADAPPIRLVPCWTDDPWGSGVAQLARMVFQEKPVALLGSLDSASTHLAEQIVAKANLPLLSPVATDKTATLAGLSWMFACAPSDRAVAELLVGEILKTTGPDRAPFALLTATDHESRMLSREILNICSSQGRLPSFQFTFTPGTTQIEVQMDALEAAQPRAVLLVATPEDAARLTIAVRQRLPRAILYGGPSFGRHEFLAHAGPASEDVRFPLLYRPDSSDLADAYVRDRFRSHFGRDPDYVSALTYDATRLLLAAIDQAGPRRAAVRQAVADLSPWNGIAGTIHFDGTGQNTRTDLVLGTIRHGSIRPLCETSCLPTGSARL